MPAPLIAAAFSAVARAALPALGRIFFGTATRAVTTAAVVDTTLNNGRGTDAVVSAAADGLGGVFRRALGLQTDPNNPNAGLLDTIMINPGKMLGLGAVWGIMTSVMNNFIGTPLAMIASLATVMYFNKEIGELAQTATNAVTGLVNPAAAATTTPAMEEMSRYYQDVIAGRREPVQADPANPIPIPGLGLGR